MTIFSVFIATLLLTFCSNEPEVKETSSGKLYIIGGGTRPSSMLNELIDLAGIRTEGYMYVLPMASAEPDSAILWAKEDFSVTGISNIYGYNFIKGELPPQDKVDSIKNARLIYISGGVQSRFMEVVFNTPVMDAIHQAYENGAVIAGTSAGAAVMSQKMITGDQLRHPESDAGFITIEADNVQLSQGLGLLKDVIIDQHFIKRQRENRLIAVAIENPDQLCIGIDESTAIIVDGDNATVSGKSQVIVIKNKADEIKIKDGRVKPSVPRHPTTVVTPPPNISERDNSGVRVEGPPSPPAPAI